MILFLWIEHYSFGNDIFARPLATCFFSVQKSTIITNGTKTNNE